VIGRRLLDTHACVRRCLEKSFVRQLDKGLADRRAADAEASNELSLTQNLAFLQPPSEDLASKQIDDLTRQTPRQLDWLHETVSTLLVSKSRNATVATMHHVIRI
jgi:hypothetical protein